MSITDFPTEATIGTSRKPKRFDIDIYQGDTFAFNLTFTGTGLDVTGWTASASVKKVSDDSAVANVITIGPVDTTNKRFVVNIDSDLLEPGTEYKYDVQVVDSSGNKRTFIGGTIVTDEDITEP